jgi:2-keto-3-deoxy-L-rhamnonate aldolase RhmA
MKLIYITSDIYEASVANNSNIDYVMVDLEVNGKRERQKGRDTLISNHTLEDVKFMRKVLTSSRLLVRINPVWKNSKEEIDRVISFGAESLMLPMFRSKGEVEEFLSLVNGRAECQLLLETSAGLEDIESILELEGISTLHVGLNDLHQELNLDFMFEIFLGEMLQELAKKVNDRGIILGIGGVGRPLVSQLVSAELIMKEHGRLGSSQVILSRDFRKIFMEPDSKHLVLMQEASKQIREYSLVSRDTQQERVWFREKLVENVLLAADKFRTSNCRG